MFIQDQSLLFRAGHEPGKVFHPPTSMLICVLFLQANLSECCHLWQLAHSAGYSSLRVLAGEEPWLSVCWVVGSKKLKQYQSQQERVLISQHV